MSEDYKLMVQEEGSFDWGMLKAGFETTVRDTNLFVTQSRKNHDTRMALWPGQTQDGKKHQRDGEKADPTPWDGASDLRVFLTDEVINTKVDRAVTAATRANLTAVPTNGYELARAKLVSMFGRWLLNTQVPEIERELELVAQYMYQDGVALTGQFWTEKVQKELRTISLDELFSQYPELSIDQLKDDKQVREALRDALMGLLGLSKNKANKVMADLIKEGVAEYEVVAAPKGYPIIRAYSLREDIYLPPYTTDLESCPEIHRVQYHTVEQVRSIGTANGWDHEWIDRVIEVGRGKVLGIQDNSLFMVDRGPFLVETDRYENLIGVVYSYRRLSDEDGIPGIFCTIWSPYCPPDGEHKGYAKHSLLPYYHGEYPFVLWRREYLSRRFFDSRGIPETGKGFQDQVKAHRDSRIDASSIAVLPPLMHPVGRAPTAWGPGARVAERRPGEYHFADRPAADANTENSEQIILKSFKEYYGEDMLENPQKSLMRQQREVDRFLGCYRKAVRQIYKLWQQFGPEEVQFRVMGLRKSDPAVMTKGDPREDFDFYLTFDALNFDTEATNTKLDRIIAAVQVDRGGQTDYSELYQVVMESIDPVIAERVIIPKAQASQQVVDKIQGDFAKLASGVPVNFTEGTPPELAMQVIQQAMQEPDVQQRYQQDEAYRKRMDVYIKQIQFQSTQQQNAMVGRMGAMQGQQ